MMKFMRFLFVLMPAIALAMPAFAQVRDLRLSDSQEPGSVIVFPKFVKGTVPIDNRATAPATEIEIGVTCPKGAVCPEHQAVKIRFHWVCPGAQTFNTKLICAESDFDVTATVWEKIVIVPDGTFAGVSNKTVPAAPCPAGYLIGWMINTSDQPIKFDALIGDAVLRMSGDAESGYGAIPIQADPALANGALIATVGGGLAFDGAPGHYQAVTGRVFGDVRYSNTTGPLSFNTTFLTLLTLDVISSRPNNPIFVPLNFYGGNPSALGNENILSTFTEFVCWTEQRIDVINLNLTTTLMGRKGVFESGPAVKFGFGGIIDNTGPVTLLGLVETVEGPTPGSAMRSYVTPLSNDSVPVGTCFLPSNVPYPCFFAE
jgi:hypothetical protein